MAGFIACRVVPGWQVQTLQDTGSAASRGGKQAHEARGTPCPHFAYKALYEQDTLYIFRIMSCLVQIPCIPYYLLLYMKYSEGRGH